MSARERILVVDDDPTLRESLAVLLRREGYSVRTASNPAWALAALAKEHFELVLTDLKMAEPGTKALSEKVGHALLLDIRRLYPGTRVILITGNQSIQSAVEAMKAGAADYITKPLRRPEITNKIAQALGREAARKESWVAPRARGSALESRAPAMREVLEMARRAAASDATVLLVGPPGSGKEALARAIHTHSHRAGSPFLATTCGGIPEALFEDELFGHERGAFTGATRIRRGLFEQAAHGTLYLDGVEEAPIALQGKLVPAIERKEIRRIGASRSIPVPARVIASTSTKLRAAVEAGRFRSELYFALRVVQLELPPLRARMEDIPELAESFLREGARAKRRNLHFGPGVFEALARHEYPGNLRELRNFVLAAATFATGDEIQAAHIERAMAQEHPSRERRPTVRDVVQSAERERIRSAVARHPRDRAAAAAELGISRTTLWRKLDQLRRAREPS